MSDLRKLAEAAKGWLTRPTIVQESWDDICQLGNASEEGEFYELIEIDCENYGQSSVPLAEFIAAANPAAVIGLLNEIDRLTAALADRDAKLAALEKQEPVDWIELNKEADAIVRSKSTWKRFIDGTPLENDIAVWMADFAESYAAAGAAPVPTGWISVKDKGSTE